LSNLFKAYFFLIFLFSTAYYTSQKITFVNEFGNELKFKRVIFQNQFRKDTFTTNRKGFIFLKSINNYDSISIDVAGEIYKQSKLELSEKNFYFRFPTTIINLFQFLLLVPPILLNYQQA